MRCRLFIGLAFALTLAQAVQAQEQRPLLIGLFRVDCVALPFASYAAGEWDRLPFWSAPPAVTNFQGPWHFAARSGEEAELNPGGVADYSTGGDSFYEGWGIETDHQPCDSSSSYSYPVRRIGIVLSEDRPTSPFEAVPDSSALHRRVATAVTPVFNKREQVRLTQVHRDSVWESRFGHPTNEERRRQEFMWLSELYTAVMDDRVYLYFVARRDYPSPDADVPFRPLSVLHGWAVEDAGSITVADAEFILDSGSEKLVNRYAPFALLPLDGELYAIAEMREYESSVKQVLKWTPTGLQPMLPRQ